MRPTLQSVECVDKDIHTEHKDGIGPIMLSVESAGIAADDGRSRVGRFQ
jgi:hypothetical protein